LRMTAEREEKLVEPEEDARLLAELLRAKRGRRAKPRRAK